MSVCIREHVPLGKGCGERVCLEGTKPPEDIRSTLKRLIEYYAITFCRTVLDKKRGFDVRGQRQDQKIVGSQAAERRDGDEFDL